MLRYCVASAALKFFSSSRWTRLFYREVLGNRIASRKRARSGLHEAYVGQSQHLLRLCRRFDAAHDGMTFLEVGTGWVHFYSLFLRLFYEARITLVDAWDNRQLAALKTAFRGLEERFATAYLPTPEESARAAHVFRSIEAASSFEALYVELGMTYVIDPTLDSIPTASIDLVYSFHVLEHIHTDILQKHLRNMHRILKPGGFQIHQLGLDDHLAHYDRKVHNKNHMRYSRRTWRLLFENDVQYFSRLLRSQWLAEFAASGMILRDESAEVCDPATVRVHPEFGAVSDADRACVIPTFVFEKPPSTIPRPPAR
jgi:SAM-dependent methyltransferase